MFWIVFILSLFSVIHCVIIGQINDYIMIGNTNYVLSNQTKDQCICQMIQSNQFLVGLNYFQTNQTCQLFYFNQNSIFIQSYFNSSFIFINQSSLSITNSEFILSTQTFNKFLSSSNKFLLHLNNIK
jgi:hypothetical protein